MKQETVDNKNSGIGLEIVFPATSAGQAWSCLRYIGYMAKLYICVCKMHSSSSFFFLNAFFLTKLFELIINDALDTMTELLDYYVTLAKYHTIPFLILLIHVSY